MKFQPITRCCKCDKPADFIIEVAKRKGNYCCSCGKVVMMLKEAYQKLDYEEYNRIIRPII